MFLHIPIEIRLSICAEIVQSDRPFLIGRCQEVTERKTNGSPRDWFPGKHEVKRNDERHRSTQPAVTRTCRQVRSEALPLFYRVNTFSLIHNEFRSDSGGSARRNSDPWIAQIPTRMFDVMQHVSLCGYIAWPNRIMIDLDLKHRRVTRIRAYSTYGDELPTNDLFSDQIQAVLAVETESDRITTLKAILGVSDSIWDLSAQHISAPPGMSRRRKPQSGFDYDW